MSSCLYVNTPTCGRYQKYFTDIMLFVHHFIHYYRILKFLYYATSLVFKTDTPSIKLAENIPSLTYCRHWNWTGYM